MVGWTVDCPSWLLDFDPIALLNEPCIDCLILTFSPYLINQALIAWLVNYFCQTLIFPVFFFFWRDSKHESWLFSNKYRCFFKWVPVFFQTNTGLCFSLGEACERHYGGCLCYGPPIESGFYYDTYLEDRQVSSLDFPNLEVLIKQIMKEKQPFERLEMRKEDLLEMFRYNPFKVRILNEKVDTPTTTVYRCGPLIDLCRGPHVRHTGKIKAMKVTKNSATYWEGKADAETLHRIYGISFPDTKLLKEWEHFQEEAAKRDHRKLGKEQELFFFHELSPGSCFFHPRGAMIYNTLIEWIRAEYRQRGFQVFLFQFLQFLREDVQYARKISFHWNFLIEIDVLNMNLGSQWILKMRDHNIWANFSGFIIDRSMEFFFTISSVSQSDIASIDWLIDWFTSFFHSMHCRRGLSDWSIDWLIDWFHFLIPFSYKSGLVDWLIDLLIFLFSVTVEALDWLIDWFLNNFMLFSSRWNMKKGIKLGRKKREIWLLEFSAFQEVISPNIYNSKLWETSGHWQHYSENMFSFDVEKEKFALKPMNCPGHCLMFGSRPRSWRELPYRMADFGVLHRNELSGTLTGLTRVRRFQQVTISNNSFSSFSMRLIVSSFQDDAHIFCTTEQIKQEIHGALDFLNSVYTTLGFTFNLKLSTRPEKYLGDVSVWNDAERQLEECLKVWVCFEEKRACRHRFQLMVVDR